MRPDRSPISKPITPGTYRHNKSGRNYEVIGEAKHTESGVRLVIYRPLDKSEHELFARPSNMFLEIIELNGQKMPRFEPISVPRDYIV